MRGIRGIAACVLILAAVGFTVRADEADEKLDKEKAQYAALYTGTLNVYLSIAEVQSGKASLANVKFDGLRLVAGQKYFLFTDDKGTWVLEPRSIYAVKVLQK